MTPYLMKKEKDFLHLGYALDNYESLGFHVSPFSLGKRREIFMKIWKIGY